jgi:PEGA domain
MRKLARIWLPAFAGRLATLALAARARAESFNITSAPSGASVEIDGALVGTTPFVAVEFAVEFAPEFAPAACFLGGRS